MQSKNLSYFAGRVVDFYRGNIGNDGLRGAWRVTKGLAMTALGPVVVRVGKRDKVCPCCGWRGSRFLPFLATGYIAFDTLCPQCDSSPRHRAHRIFYEQQLGFSKRKGKLLYFAPERNLAYFRDIPGLEVKTSQYPDGDSDYHLDILDMPFGEGEWDYIVCHRVIEHLKDDRAGMLAFHKILKPGGFAVISVPIDAAYKDSIDYGKPNPLENEHYYYYGTDFRGRIPEAFEVDEFRFSDTFSPQQHDELALIDDWVFVCRKPQAATVAPA
jgi:SAM-dependent methyltransferase